MKRIALLMLAATAIAVAQGQDKPRVFINGKGTENVSTNASAGGNRWFRSGRADNTIGAHDEGMEVTKNLQKGCPGIIVTINQSYCGLHRHARPRIETESWSASHQ